MAAKYWVGGNASPNNNATSPTNWSLSSGGTGNAAAPTISDDVYFDSNSGALPWILTASTSWKSLTITSGYTGLMTHNTGQNLTVVNNITLSNNYSIAGLGNLIWSGAGTLTSNGMVWPNNLTLSGVFTKVLSGDFNIGGLLSVSGVTVLNGAILYCVGLTSASAISGTASIVLKGGTWGSVGIVSLASLSFDGNVTIAGSLNIKGTTLNYISGTIVTSGSTLIMSGAIVLNTSPIIFNLVAWSGITSMTINSLFQSATLQINNLSFSILGTAGFIIDTLNDLHAVTTATLTFAYSNTYIVTKALNIFRMAYNNPLTYISNDPTQRVPFILQYGATCNVANVNFTRFNASGGRTITTFNGVVTDSPNIVSFNDFTTVASSF